MSDDLMNKAVSEIEFVKMSSVERRRYEAHLAALSDKASELLHAKQEGRHEGRQEGQAIGQHMAKQQMLNKLVRKKFIGLPQSIQKKILMLTDAQLDQQLEMLMDDPNQEAFVEAISGLKTEQIE